jgi:hypothetical protein
MKKLVRNLMIDVKEDIWSDAVCYTVSDVMSGTVSDAVNKSSDVSDA